MKFYLIIFLVVLMIPFVSSIETCVNTTDNRQICFDIDSGMYPQNIDLFEGQNENFGLHILNPESISNQDLFSKIKTNIKNFFSSNKVDVTALGDQTNFEFRSFDDFYTFLQQRNAVGNVTLFTSKDLNSEERKLTRVLIGNVLTWTKILMIVMMEFFKLMLNVVLLIGSMFLFFRLIPFSLNKIKILVFKLMTQNK